MSAGFDWLAIRAQLSQAFDDADVYWRAGAVSKDRKRAQALPYADPRAYEQRLDEVIGLDWSCDFEPWGDHRIIARVTLCGVTRSSTGEESDGGFAPGTATEAQAFKRACSKFGLGRYLYSIPIVWVDYDSERKRLLSTPDIPDRYKTGASVTPVAQVIGSARAEALGYELEKLGYPAKRQLNIATNTLGYTVTSLATLTEPEALEVWHAVKRSAA